MKFVVAPNAFKGTLSAQDAAFTIAKAVRVVFPDAEIVQLPIADGGSGTLDALVESTLGDFVEADCHDAVGETMIAPWGVMGKNLERPRTAIIELATTCGLKNIPWKRRNPLETSTFGAGEQIAAALDDLCCDFIIGLGDTGTHDCGAGIAEALGIRLLDKSGAPIGRGGAELLKLRSIDAAKNLLRDRGGKVIAACDVSNPLTGKNNTAKLFAPQKGATPDGVKTLEDASAHFASIVKRELGKDVATIDSGGAAGGVGAGLMAFFNAELRSGAELVLDCTGFNEKALDADVILTGEGRLDEQTLSGKAVAALSARAKTLRVPVIAFAGLVDESDSALRKKLGLKSAICCTPDSATEADAIKNAQQFLYDAVTSRLRDALDLR